MQLLINLILVSLTLVKSLNYEELEGKAVHVSLIYRHGERTPKWVPETDPYDEKFWPEGFGQLTEQGMLHHYRLGQSLRLRYFHLLQNGHFRTKTMCTLSTPFDRTIMSALSNLAGMFPVADNEKFADINWKPIPVHTTSLTDDKILAMENLKCKSYEDELNQVMNTQEFKTKNESFQELYKTIKNATGRSLNNPEDLQDVYSLLLIYEMKGLTLPEWSKTIYPHSLKEASDYSFTMPTSTTKMKRLKSGPLLKKIMETFEKKINSTIKKCSNITAYSAHDDVIANFLNTIEIFDKLTPPFAACIMVELRKTENKYFISVLYQNSTDPTKNDPHILKIPKCGFSCPYEKFKEIFEPVIPKNWDEECQN